MATLTFKEAAEAVLRAADTSLSYKQISKRALSEGLISSEGQAPEASVNAQLSMDISRKGSDSVFIRTAPGVYGLRSWLGRDGVDAYSKPDDKDARIRVPFYPDYRRVARLLEVLDGVTRADFLALNSDIHARTGTPQDQVDWSDPDTWIDERLSGPNAELARRIWKSTRRFVNPRHMTGAWRLINHYELLETHAEGVLVLTGKGHSFISDPSGPTVQEIDVQEGLDRVLGLVAELGPAGRAELVPPFAQFAREVSNIRADSTIKAFLRTRLRNLCERDLIERTGRTYSATDAGLTWLAQIGDEETTEKRQETDILQLVRQRRYQVRQEIADRLSTMDPFAFEHLVKTLLEAMDYEDVEVTSKSGDGGVDVIARIQLGITEVVEVVQVKRHARNIQRSVMDALRGSLHRFGAVRGTIITTGGFASGTKKAAFEPGAAPITLIDGQRLIDLMLENDFGVSKRRLELLEIEPSAFAAPPEDEGADERPRYQPEEDPQVTQFWRDYWLLARELAPELELPKPQAKPSAANFVWFRPGTLPADVTIVHKLGHGRVDLQFAGMGDRLGELRSVVGPRLEPDMSVDQATKSGVIRLSVPELDTSVPFDTQRGQVEAGIRAAARLLSWHQTNASGFRWK